MIAILRIPALIISLLVLMASGVFQTGQAAPRQMPSAKAGEGQQRNFKQGEVLIKFKQRTRAVGRSALRNRMGGRRLKHFPHLRMEHVRLPVGMSVEQAIERYRNDPEVEYIEPNYQVHSTVTVPNDTFFSELWGLQNTGQTGGTAGADIQVTDAWDLTTGDSSLIVAVIDTGVDYNHEDIIANLWVNSQEIAGNGIDDDGNGYIDDIYGIDTHNHDSDPIDDNGHGTHVSGTIGAVGNNNLGVAGVNWDVKVLNCKFLNQDGSGWTDDAIECLDYIKALKDRGENIVTTSNSWGCLGCYSQALADAIEAQRQSDILFIAAAGNANCDNDDDIGTPINYPSSYDHTNIIAVAATDHNDGRAWFSCFGRRTVDVGAPGVDIVSLRAAGTDFYGDGNHFIPAGDPDARYYRSDGTSMATPHVAGLAALLQAQDPARNSDAIRNLILAGGTNTAAMNGMTLTGKRINAFASTSCTDRPLLAVLQYPDKLAEYVVGSPTVLSAHSINCAAAVGPVTVTTSTGGVVNLLDDGVAPDVAANDGIFTANWTPTQATDVLSFSSAAGSETVNVPAFPDLVVTEASPILPSAETGQPIRVWTTVRNQGDVLARVIKVNLYLSTDSTITTDDILIDSYFTYNIGPANETRTYASALVPAGLPSGTYYVGAIVDPDNTIDEVTGEDNNSFAGATINISEVYADVVVSEVTGPAVAAPGETVSFSARIQNLGDGWAWQNFPINFYLSTDNVITADDLPLNPWYLIRGFPAGSDRIIVHELTIPADLAEGTYYIGAIADKDSTVLNELDRSNNIAAGGTIVISDLKPDLVVSAASGVVDANTLTVNATIVNQGAILSGASVAGIYLSTDNIISVDDHFIGSQAVAELAVGAEQAISFSGVVPDSIPNGNYYIGVIANYDGTVFESNSANNVLAGNSITLDRVLQLPDLVVSSISGTVVDRTLSVSVTVTNQGTATLTASHTTGFYLSTDATITTDDHVVLGLYSSQDLAPGESLTLTYDNWTIPDTVPDGVYYLGAYADRYDSALELDETNNGLAGNQVTLGQVGADLVVTAVSANQVGDQLTVTTTILNQGTGDSDNFLAGVYLSTDATIDETDTYLGYGFPGAVLPAGQEVTLSIVKSVPSHLASGNYYVGILADSDQRIAETDETNNTLAGNQITVAKDLVVTSVAGSLLGDQLTVTVTVLNQGSTSSDNFLAGVYLSTDATIDETDTYLGYGFPGSTLAGGAEVTLTITKTVPTTLADGSYYVGVIADSDHRIAETDETNNSLAGNTISIQSGTDLLVTNVSANLVGDQITVVATVLNTGSVAAGYQYVGLYLSADTAIGGGDYFLGYGTIASLAGGAEATVTVTKTVSSAVGPGSYYVIANADHYLNVTETDETNNSLAGNQVSTTRDLIVTGVTANLVGDQLTVNATVQNTGSIAAGYQSVGIYLSADTAIGGGDYFLGYGTISSLAGGAETTMTVTKTVSSAVGPGTYYVIANADHYLAVSETDETNNSLAGNQVSTTRDLIVSGVTASLVGDQLTVNATVQNTGSIAAGYQYVGIYLSADTAIGGGDYFIGYGTISSLGGGAETIMTVTKTVSTAVVPGTYYVIANADHYLGVSETDETNNSLAGNQVVVP